MSFQVIMSWWNLHVTHEENWLWVMDEPVFSLAVRWCSNTDNWQFIRTLVIVSDKTFKILGKFLARSCKIMHYSCRKMQDSCKESQFLTRILKEISGLMKSLKDMSGSWNISIFFYKAILRKQLLF